MATTISTPPLTPAVFHILLALSSGERHGYGIMKQVEADSQGNVTMGPGTHQGSKNNLLGKNPSQELVDLMSNEKQVTAKTPPAFIVHSTTDKAVPVSNSDNYAEALKKAGVPYEYVRLDHGEHGYGLKDFWTVQCEKWLKANKF